MKLASLSTTIVVFMTVAVLVVPAKGHDVGPALNFLDLSWNTGVAIFKSFVWDLVKSFTRPYIPNVVSDYIFGEDKPESNKKFCDCTRESVTVSHFTPELFTEIERLFQRVSRNTSALNVEQLYEFLHNQTTKSTAESGNLQNR